MVSDEVIMRIIIRKSKERFRADTVEATNILNKRKNVHMRKPSISEKNNMIVFTSKKISTKRESLLHEVKRVGRRIVFTFETAKTNRNALFANAK